MSVSKSSLKAIAVTSQCAVQLLRTNDLLALDKFHFLIYEPISGKLSTKLRYCKLLTGASFALNYADMHLRCLVDQGSISTEIWASQWCGKGNLVKITPGNVSLCRWDYPVLKDNGVYCAMQVKVVTQCWRKCVAVVGR